MPKFIQITYSESKNSNALFALTAEGTVWVWQWTVWAKAGNEREWKKARSGRWVPLDDWLPEQP